MSLIGLIAEHSPFNVEKSDCDRKGKRYNGDIRAVAEGVVSEGFIARA